MTPKIHSEIKGPLDLAFDSHLCVVGGKESRAIGTREGGGGGLREMPFPAPRFWHIRYVNPRGKD